MNSLVEKCLKIYQTPFDLNSMYDELERDLNEMNIDLNHFRIAVGRFIIRYLSSINHEMDITNKLLDFLSNYTEVWDGTGLTEDTIMQYTGKLANITISYTKEVYKWACNQCNKLHIKN
jgi:hypothetical protein